MLNFTNPVSIFILKEWTCMGYIHLYLATSMDKFFKIFFVHFYFLPPSTKFSQSPSVKSSYIYIQLQTAVFALQKKKRTGNT